MLFSLLPLWVFPFLCYIILCKLISGYSEGMGSKRRENVQTWLIISHKKKVDHTIDSGSDYGQKFRPRRRGIDGHHKMISRFK